MKWTLNKQISPAFVSFLLISNLVSADDWTQWRGTNRDGKSSEVGLLAKWPVGGPKLLWQAKNLGSGYSTPSVVGDQLFVISNQGNEKEEVLALATSDGQKLWSTAIGKVGPNQGPQYPGTRATPTVSGDSVYALGSDGDLVCLDSKSGQKKWAKNLRTDFSGVPGMWAYTESPLIDGDVLICSPGGSVATVVALQKSTGAPVWKSPLTEGDAASYSSPIVSNIDGVKQLGTCTPPNSSDRGTSKAWTHPVISNGRLYIRDQGDIWCYDIRG